MLHEVSSQRAGLFTFLSTLSSFEESYQSFSQRSVRRIQESSAWKTPSGPMYQTVAPAQGYQM